jgi:NAD(P)H-hydrate epimerase
MMKYVSVAEMQSIERQANASGLSYERMMENAGRGLAEVVLEAYGYLAEGGALGMVGSGNNGGDTLVALAYLAQEGWNAEAAILRPRPEGDPLVKRLQEAGGRVAWLEAQLDGAALEQLLDTHDLLLDGVLGTGARLPLKAEVAQALGFARRKLDEMEKPPVVVAVDCPSGVDCDSGEAAPECLPAELTVTMAAVKHGLLKFPAHYLVGELRVVGIGLADDGEGLQAWLNARCMVPDLEWVRTVLPQRPADAHKGTFGTALIAAGTSSYTGAAWLAGQAAYRIGAGLVTLAVPAPLHAALAGQFPEATWVLLPQQDGFIAAQAEAVLQPHLGRATALLVGPGFGLEPTTGEFLSRLLSSTGAGLPPMVVDADGLKLLRQIPNWAKRLPSPAVLTPHPGEMSVLTGLPKEQIQADRLDLAQRCSQEWGHVVVLKGAFTIIAEPDGAAAIIPVATPALARAGTGDVLAGLIAGLRAQGVGAFESAVAGAWIHAYAGLQAVDEVGNPASVLAGDVLRGAVSVITDLLI